MIPGFGRNWGAGGGGPGGRNMWRMVGVRTCSNCGKESLVATNKILGGPDGGLSIDRLSWQCYNCKTANELPISLAT